MADSAYVDSDPPTTTNTNDDRGWNDPPSYVFSPTNANRKRIDPRKRVGHDLTSGTGIVSTQPHQSVPFSNGATKPGCTDHFIPPTLHAGVLTMPTQTATGSLPHANSNPDISNLLNRMPLDHQSTSMPFNLNAHELKAVHNPPFYNNMPQQQQALSSQPSTLKSNDKAQDGRKLIAPTNNLNSSIFSQMTTPTMLQSSHLANKSNTLDVSTAMTQNISTVVTSISPNTSVKSDSLPDLQQRTSPTNAIVAAPPANGFYATKVYNSNPNSPKSTSPYNSSQSSPKLINDKRINMADDNELLNEIVGRLLDICNKCACVITNKMSEEINKKIQAFKKAWTSGKLSSNVKMQLSGLSLALDKREFSRADSVHKSLVVSHASEVMPWMIGIKKLISSYQKVVQDNNKY